MDEYLESKSLDPISLDWPNTLEEKSPIPNFTFIVGNISENKKLQGKTKRKPLNLTVLSAKLAGYKKGIFKTCQDEMLATSFGKEESFSVLFSIFDGHGPDGHLVAKLGRLVLPRMFQKMMNDISTKEKKLSEGIEKVFSQLDELVKSQNEVMNVEMSGSTLVTVLLTGGRVYCAWVGDSRAMVAYQIDRSCFYKTLSADHLPDLETERNRILASGGIIHPSKDAAGNFYGPERVWNPKYSEHPAPGLMMSRSIGDFAGKEVGVSCRPDVIDIWHDPSLKFLVLASDGVWEVLSDVEVGEIVRQFLTSRDRIECARIVLEHANHRWSFKSNSYRDDMSVIVVFF